MKDQIIVTDLRLNCIIGCNPEERLRPQPILVSFTIATDFRAASHPDDLKLTIDYHALANDLRAFAEASRFQLIETLAERIAERILAFSPYALSTTVRVAKPEALAPHAACAAVELTRP